LVAQRPAQRHSSVSKFEQASLFSLFASSSAKNGKFEERAPAAPFRTKEGHTQWQ
jgi:hypothetical protein